MISHMVSEAFFKASGKMPQKRPAEWEANHLRLSLFFLKAVPEDKDPWNELLHSPPEQYQRNAKDALIVRAGPFEGGQLQLTTTPLRLDLIWVPTAPELQTLVPQAPRLTLGNYDGAAEKFRAL